jgi:hypothetical protein
VPDILHIQKVSTEKLEAHYTRVMMESPSIAANMFQTGDFVFKALEVLRLVSSSPLVVSAAS